jgi:hypothetical protein
MTKRDNYDELPQKSKKVFQKKKGRTDFNERKLKAPPEKHRQNQIWKRKWEDSYIEE